jgi:hypothetical protein
MLPMITNKDTTKIITALKEIIYTKEEIDKKFEEQSNSFSKLQTSVDNIAITSKNQTAELKVLNNRTKRMEDWVIKASEKVQIPYDR